MTANQIEYVKHLETQRANRAQERLTSLRDAGTLKLRSSELAETIRANQRRESIQEQLNHQQLYEANRHNLATESLTLSQIRNDLARVGISQRQQAVAERQATVNERQATVAERQATVSERLADYQRFNLGVASQNADTARIGALASVAQAGAAQANAATQAYLAEETKRHNERQEAIGSVQATASLLGGVSSLGQSVAALGTSRANLQNARTNAGGLSLNREKFEFTKWTDRAESVSRTVNQASQAARNVAEIFKIPSEIKKNQAAVGAYEGKEQLSKAQAWSTIFNIGGKNNGKKGS